MTASLRPLRLVLAATAATFALTPATGQRVPPANATPYTRAIAAGYKALTLCNGIYGARRNETQIAKEELAGIYPEYDALIPSLPAMVLPFQGVVEVDWSDTLPRRHAAWDGDAHGCRLLPIGMQARFLIPEGIPLKTPQLAPDPRAWPMGDADIHPRPAPALKDAVVRAFTGGYGADAHTTGVLVLRDGVVTTERYAPGWGPFTANRTWSAAKSLTGTLIGLAGLDPAKSAGLPQWQNDARAEITMGNLLRMASGLHSGAAGNRTDAIYFGGVAVDQEATGWPLEVKPGTRFRYANDDILLAALRLRAEEAKHVVRPGWPAFSYPEQLFAALGMRNTRIGRDPHGNYILSSQVWSTARDLARLGQFWLQDGVWEGKRLLPEGWVKYMTTPSGPQPAEGPGYGATLWLFGPKQGLPEGSYAAQGNRGQYIMVVPSERLVVVRRGEDPGAARFDIARFTADLIAAGR